MTSSRNELEKNQLEEEIRLRRELEEIEDEEDEIKRRVEERKRRVEEEEKKEMRRIQRKREEVEKRKMDSCHKYEEERESVCERERGSVGSERSMRTKEWVEESSLVSPRHVPTPSSSFTSVSVARSEQEGCGGEWTTVSDKKRNEKKTRGE